VRGPDVRQHHRPPRVAAAAAGACAVAAVLAATAGAGSQPAELPSAVTPLTAEPPLAGAVSPVLEVRFPGRVDSTVRVVARQRPDGRVVAVRALQRLVVRGRGDYSFAVPAPVTDVEAGAGSESEPGLRRNAVLWQGFSPGRRLLASSLELDPEAVARALPLSVRLVRIDARTVRLTIVNRTVAAVDSYAAAGVPSTVAAALDAARRTVAAGRTPGPLHVQVRAPVRRERRRTGATFAVSVRLVLPPGSRLAEEARTVGLRTLVSAPGVVRARGRLAPGAKAMLALQLQQPTPRLPVVSVTAVVVRPLALLEPPTGGSWSAYVGRPHGRVNAVRLLDRAIDALLAVARTRQFERFVDNPDPAGAARTTFGFTVTRASSPASAAGPPSNDDSPLPEIAFVALLAAAAVAAVITWAYS
jgi:hypothetical protein